MGAGRRVTVRSQNTQGYKNSIITAERQRAATASAHGQATVTTLQEAGAAPPSWNWLPDQGSSGSVDFPVGINLAPTVADLEVNVVAPAAMMRDLIANQKYIRPH